MRSASRLARRRSRNASPSRRILRLATTPEELRAQFELKVAIRDRLSKVHETINSIRRLRKQLDGWIERAKTHERGECLRERAAALKEKLLPIEEALINLYNDRPQPGPAASRISWPHSA